MTCVKEPSKVISEAQFIISGGHGNVTSRHWRCCSVACSLYRVWNYSPTPCTSLVNHYQPHYRNPGDDF